MHSTKASKWNKPCTHQTEYLQDEARRMGWDPEYGTGVTCEGGFSYNGETPDLGPTIPWIQPTRNPVSNPFGGKNPEAGKR